MVLIKQRQKTLIKATFVRLDPPAAEHFREPREGASSQLGGSEPQVDRCTSVAASRNA